MNNKLNCFTLKQNCFWKCQEGLECKKSFGIGQFSVYKCAQPEGAGPDPDDVDMWTNHSEEKHDFWLFKRL